MGDESSRFDPRFDPAFQRGYDGPTPQAAPRKRVPRRTESPPDPIGMPPEGGAYVRGPVAVPRPGRARVAEDEAEEILEEDARPVANPFLLALLAVGAGVTAAGIALLAGLPTWLEQASKSGASSQYNYFYLQSITWGAPMLVCVGIAILAGVLFVFAVRWRR